MKLYDITFAFLIALIFGLGFSSKSFAGGNDPVMKVSYQVPNRYSTMRLSGGGNDPTAMMDDAGNGSGTMVLADAGSTTDLCGGGGHDPNGQCGPQAGGGGHDPINDDNGKQPACYLKIENKFVPVQNARLCGLQGIINVLSHCDSIGQNACDSALYEINGMVLQLKQPTKQ